MGVTRKIHTTVVGDAHSYTRADSPWKLDQYSKKLFRYISGGGIKSLGRTVEQELDDAKRTRFLVASAVLAAIWAALLFV